MLNTMWWFAAFTLKYCPIAGLGNPPSLVSPPLVFGEWREKWVQNNNRSVECERSVNGKDGTDTKQEAH
jgi:hypothetical protein